MDRDETLWLVVLFGSAVGVFFPRLGFMLMATILAIVVLTV